MATPASGREPLEKLAEEFAERYRRGERPSLTEYAERYPELAEEIRELFPALVEMEQLASGTGPAAPAGSSPGLPPQHLGEYQILREIGRGGMGVVYEAVQQSLGRHVALKVLPFHSLLSPTQLERFRREARATARLHHTNIVPVFGVGEESGLHYYAMQFIQGQSLDTVLDEVRRLRGRTTALAPATETAARALSACVAQGLVSGRFPASRADGSQVLLEPTAVTADAAAYTPGPQPEAPARDAAVEAEAGERAQLSSLTESQYFRSVAQVALQVAEGLAYAHREGILHRDIKPSNLLLDTHGTVWITDFGLAKANDSDDLTQTGDLVGTLRFMAPERFAGQADARSDVYGLGITLYELLTLRPAFEDSQRARLIERVLHEELPRPRRLEPHIPRDLETIVLKAIAKEPAARYPSASALGEDLRRFLADRPIRARRSSTAEKLWRWCRRNPAVASLSATILLLLVVLTAGGLVETAQLSRALGTERAKLWESLRDRAQALRMSRRPGQRVESLRSIAEAMQLPLPPGHFLAEMRTEAIAALALPDLSVEREWQEAPSTIGLAFDGKLEHYVRLGADRSITLGRVGDGQVIACWQEAAELALWPDRNHWFSRDGRYLAVWYGGSQRLAVWQLDGPEPRVCYRSQRASNGNGLGFTPDSTKLTYLLTDARIAVVDLASGREHYLPPTGEVQGGIAFAPEGRRFAIGIQRAGNYAVEVRDLATGRVQVSLPHPAMAWPCNGWHADGRTLATSCNDRLIRLWDVPSGKLLRTLEGHRTVGIYCSFDSTGQRLLSNDWDAVLRLWEPSSGRQLLAFPAGGYSLLNVSPDNRLVVQHVADARRLQLLRLHGGLEYRTFRVGSKPGNVVVHPGGRLLAVYIEHADTVALVDLAAGREVGHLPTSRCGPLLWEPSGALLTCGPSGLLRWPVRIDRGSPARYHIGPAKQLLTGGAVDLWGASSDGQTIAIPQYDQGAVVLHRGPPPRLVRLQPQQDVRCCAVSPDGRWVATGSHGNRDGFGAKVWEAASGRLVQALAVPAFCSVAFSPDGRWLLTTSGGCRLWAAGTWAEGPTVGGASGCFSPDGRLLAVEDSPGVIRLVEAATGTEVVRLEAPEQARLVPRAFTPDGSRLIAAGFDTQALHVWDLRALRQGLAELGLDWDAPPYPSAAPAGAVPALDVQVAPVLSWEAGQVVGQSLLLAQSPWHYLPYLRRAAAYAALGDISRAAADYRQAWALLPAETRRHLGKGSDPFSEPYVRGLARVLQELGADPMKCNNRAWQAVTGPPERHDPLLALVLAEKAVALAPNQEGSLNTLGVVYYRLGWYRQAITTLQRSRRSNAFAAFDLFPLAMCYARLGEAAKARACYDEAVRWVQEHEGKLPARYDAQQFRAELKAFRAEADAALAQPAGP